MKESLDIFYNSGWNDGLFRYLRNIHKENQET